MMIRRAPLRFAIKGNPAAGQTSGYAPFTDQTAKLNWILAPQVTFIPFRGKLAIFNKIFVDADFYAAAGWAFTGIQERGDCGGAAPQPEGYWSAC